MIQLSQALPNIEIVATLSQQSRWSHIKLRLPARTAEARLFYIEQAMTARLSVRAA
ncbi:hypothetical protein [Microbacterium sp.]|uniref:hypothetical protein n=1 Tax=Microbacterium sp. TaxID=51671 RepID=UPI003A91D10B